MPLTDLRNIPTIMRANNWLNGAKMLDTWFSRPAAVAPAYSNPPETSTIKMDSFVLQYWRARTKYHEIMDERLWCNPAGQAQLGKVLRRNGYLTSAPLSYTPPTSSMADLDRDMVNQRAVGVQIPLDDMVAALGRFSLRVVTRGTVEPSGDGHIVTVTDVGVYVCDSFDFNGEQLGELGYWDEDTNRVSCLAFPGGTYVTNADFRLWRRFQGIGGDFMIYSDVKWTHLAKPDTFSLGPFGIPDPVSQKPGAGAGPGSGKPSNGQPGNGNGKGTAYTVKSGDSLSLIAGRFWGEVLYWPLLHKANLKVVGSDPNKIYPGQPLVIPDIKSYTQQQLNEAKAQGRNWR